MNRDKGLHNAFPHHSMGVSSHRDKWRRAREICNSDLLLLSLKCPHSRVRHPILVLKRSLFSIARDQLEHRGKLDNHNHQHNRTNPLCMGVDNCQGYATAPFQARGNVLPLRLSHQPGSHQLTNFAEPRRFRQRYPQPLRSMGKGGGFVFLIRRVAAYRYASAVRHRHNKCRNPHQYQTQIWSA